jgi:hypothetical protein
VLAVLLLACGVLAIVCSGGTYRSIPRDALITPARQAAGPAWTRPCWASVFDSDQRACVQLAGRVVWMQKHDPDGDGDRHLVVVSRLRPHIVKLDRAFPVHHLPGLGARVAVTGWIEVGAHGREEIRALTYTSGGTRAAVRR